MNIREAFVFLKERWGLSRFVILFLSAAILSILVLNSPEFWAPLFKSDGAFVTLIFLNLFMFIVSFTSFFKIFKFKTYLLGHLYFVTGLIYLYVTHFAFGPQGALLTMESLHKVNGVVALHVLLGVMSFNLLIIVVSPPSLRFKLTRFWAILIAAAEAVLYFVILRNIEQGPATSVLISGPGFMATIYLVNLASFALSLLLVKEDNSFGGVIGALALVNLFVAHSLEIPPFTVAAALFATLPLFVTTGVVLFWFSCLHYRVAYDPLLQIYNRDYAHNIISGMSHISLGRSFCVAMIDIDHFKAVNDTHGHQTGDEVLHGTAQVVKQICVPQGVACRYGGEEIIVFFRNLRETEAHAVCEHIRREIRRKRYVSAGKEFAVSVSIGIAECDDPGVPMDRVVKSADEALYRAKETGRNKVLIGQLKKRLNDPTRPTYQFMKLTGAERRKPTPQENKMPD